jgi:hypothetical protein
VIRQIELIQNCTRASAVMPGVIKEMDAETTKAVTQKALSL